MHNSLFHGISGKLGKIVFRQRGGKTIVTSAPRKSNVKTEKQKQQQEQFKLAAVFGKTVMLEPQLQKYYEGFAKKLKCPSAYTAAVKDYLIKPEIKNISIAGYHGYKGDVITITPAEPRKFYVAWVQILNADGMVEEGQAQYDPAETEFNYVARKNNDLYPSSAVIVTLTDTPGNHTEDLVECWTEECEDEKEENE